MQAAMAVSAKGTGQRETGNGQRAASPAAGGLQHPVRLVISVTGAALLPALPGTLPFPFCFKSQVLR